MKNDRLKQMPILLLAMLFLNSFAWMGCEQKKESQVATVAPANISNNAGADSMGVDPQSLSLLHRGLDFLGGLDQFSVQTQSSLEDMLDSTHRVDYATSGNLIVDRPNKIRIERYGLKLHQIFFFDGIDFTLNNPNENVYATEPLAGNIEDMFNIARDSFGLSAPASDLVYRNSYSLLTHDLNAGVVIGKEMIGDVVCDHLLFSNPAVSFQIWISDQAPHLPYKYVVTDRSTAQLLSFSTEMRNWNILPKLTESMFKFVPPKEVKKIIFLKTSSNNGHSS